MVEIHQKVICPRCGGTVQWENNVYRPFCSERCKLIDLGKWLEEQYRVPAAEETSDERTVTSGGGSDELR